MDIHELQAKAERITGKPQPVPHGDKVVAEVIYRDGTIIDRIYNTL
jgi:citrate lyase subunit alpha/citrate CoA-transferase